MSSSILKTLQIRKPASLPVYSTADVNEPGLLRRRLSSLSRNHPSTDRSKSVSAMGEKGWWEWSWSLIVLKKLPILFTDVEFNKEPSLGNHQRGTFGQVFFRIRRLFRTSSSDSLPLSCNR